MYGLITYSTPGIFDFVNALFALISTTSIEYSNPLICLIITQKKRGPPVASTAEAELSWTKELDYFHFIGLPDEVSMVDPVKRAFEIAETVCHGDKRKYSRFRAARFYGGIATADCVGCCLRCIFCWSYENATKLYTKGDFYSPEEVVQKLIGIARKRGFDQVRKSGSEPTLCKEHLLGILDLIPEDIHFILETNGIPIGYDDDYARALARHKNIHVRVSLKGTSEGEFSRLTGADPVGFELQLKALENLIRAGVSTHAAVMVSFSRPADIQALQERLARIAKELEEIEIEELVFFNPGVEERLRKAGIKYRTAYRRDNIPPEQV